MARAQLLIVAILLAGCSPASQTAARPAPLVPARVISLDYCADQYVLRFVDPSRILALSPDASRAFSYERARAIGLPTVLPRAEDVVQRGPDLVVRSYGGGPKVTSLLEKAGVPVLNLGYTGSIKDIIETAERVAAALGNVAEGQAVAAQMRARLQQLSDRTHRPRALYLTPTGVTSGPGSLIHEMLTAAGLSNYSSRSGWHPLPLEQLAYRAPDLIAAAFFDGGTNHRGAWSPTRHPVAQRQLREQAVVPLQGAWTACGGWFLMDAIEALASAGRPR